MFDVGFSELGVIGLVALIVIGPEQLPRVARTVGHLMGRLRRYVSDVKSDISREMELADLKRLQQEVEDSARSLESSFREQVSSVEADMHRAIGNPDMHHLADNTVAEATGDPAADDQLALALPAAQASQVDPVEPVVDPNQMDLFGVPTASPSPASSPAIPDKL